MRFKNRGTFPRLCRVTSASTHFTHRTNHGLGGPGSLSRTHSKLSVQYELYIMVFKVNDAIKKKMRGPATTRATGPSYLIYGLTTSACGTIYA